jgi:uncharacterized repeat protein (TIGR01451 family)
MAKGKSSLFSSVLESLGFSRRKQQKRGKQRLLKLEPLENRQLLTVVLSQTYTLVDDGNHVFEAGEKVSFTITATNSAPAGVPANDADNVYISEDLSGSSNYGLQGATYNSSVALKASSNPASLTSSTTSYALSVNASDLLTFQGGSSSGSNGFVLAGGQSVSITFSAIVNAAYAPSVTNNVGANITNPTCTYSSGTDTGLPMEPPSQISFSANTFDGSGNEIPPALVNIDMGLTPLKLAGGSQNGNQYVTSTGGVSYQLTVTNNGPSAATAVLINDASEAPVFQVLGWQIDGTLPSGATVLDENNGGDNVTPSSGEQTGDLYAEINLPFPTGTKVPPGVVVTFTVYGTVALGSGQVTNSAAVIGELGNEVDTSSVGWNPSAVVTAPAAPVEISIAEGASASVTPGDTTATTLYTFTVTNNDTYTSDAAVSGISLQDAGLSSLPLSNLSWSVTDVNDPYNLDTGNSNGNTLSGTGSIDGDSLILSPGESLTYTISGTANANAEHVVGGTTLSDTVSLAIPANYTESSSDTTTVTPGLTLTPQVALTVAKTSASASVVPGASLTYTIAVSNGGPSDATNVTVTDALDSQINSNNVSWSESGVAGSHSGALNATVADLAPGTTATFTEIAQVKPGLDDSGTTANNTNGTALAEAQTTDAATPAYSSGCVVSLAAPAAILVVHKSAGYNTTTNPAVPGTVVTYTVTVSDNGPSDATSVQLSDAVDGDINTSSSSLGWSAATNGATASAGLTDNLGIVASGTMATVYFIAPIYSSASGTTADTVTASAADAANASSPQYNLALTPQANLGITQTDSQPGRGGSQFNGNSATGTIGLLELGQAISYTINVANTGPSDATEVTVSDPLPTTALSNLSFTCTATAGPSGSPTGFTSSATGVTQIDNTGVYLPAGSSIQYVVTGTVGSSKSFSPLSNTATVTCASDTNPNNSAEVTDALPVDLSVAITDSANGVSSGTGGPSGTVGSAIPGDAITYTLVVSNSNPTVATGATVTDSLPVLNGLSALSGLKLVSATPNGGTATSAAKTGSISDAFSDTVTLGYNASITYVISGTILSADTGSLSSTATVSPNEQSNSDTTNNTATDTDNLTPQGDLTITTSDSDGGSSAKGANVIPGTSITFTIVAKNLGTSDVYSAAITDALPAGFTVLSSTGTDTANSSGVAPSGFNNSPGGAAIPVYMPAGSSITYKIVGTIDPSLPAGSFGYSAEIDASTALYDFTDTDAYAIANSTNHTSASESDTLVPTAKLQLAVTDSGSGNALPGSTFNYTVTLSNAGPSDAPVVNLSDALSASMSGAITSASLVSVTKGNGAIDTSGASLANVSGSYTLTDTADLPAGSSAGTGGSIQYVISVVVSPSGAGLIYNTATVTVPALGQASGLTDSGNSTATDNVSLAKADLVWSLSGQKTAATGRDVLYAINVTNYGPGKAVTVYVTDTLPKGETFSSVSVNGTMLTLTPTVNSNGTTTVALPVTQMNVGASEVVVIDATVNANDANGAVLQDTANVNSGFQQQTTNAGQAPTSPNGLLSLTLSTQVNANGASLVPNLTTGKMDLVITDGPAASNTVMVLPSSSGAGYTVLIDGHMQAQSNGSTSFACTGRIVIYGDSNDYEWVSPSITKSAWLYGGKGRDYLYGGGGNDVIIGGPGTNYISGGAGWNLLIGGGGGGSPNYIGGGSPNYIQGITGNNLEISGTTSYDANQAALNAILNEWDSGDKLQRQAFRTSPRPA